MKKIVTINASLRTAWNTSALVRAAAKGADGARALDGINCPLDIRENSAII